MCFASLQPNTKSARSPCSAIVALRNIDLLLSLLREIIHQVEMAKMVSHLKVRASRPFGHVVHLGVHFLTEAEHGRQ